MKRICPAIKEACHYLACTGSKCLRKTPPLIPFKRASKREPSKGPTPKGRKK